MKHTSTTDIIRNKRCEKDKLRKKIATLSAIGLLDFIPIALYQLGMIRHLPDPPGRLFDSDYVNASDEAKIFGISDGPVSLSLYAANIGLAAASLSWKKTKIFDYAIAINAIGQAGGGTFYLINMITKQKRICPYCVAGAMINFIALVPLYRLLFGKS